MQKTLDQYDGLAAGCRATFKVKTSDYGTAWRVLRPASLTDQIMIKAKRIRTLQQVGGARVEESQDDAFEAIVNYSIMALIQLDEPVDEMPEIELDPAHALARYDEKMTETRELMIRKNHDYGEAWRDMRVSSITDLILMKLLRIKQIEDNAGQTLVSEGLAANYQDIINYAFFALILREEEASTSSPTMKNK
ncbi:MAG: DUF1599 domain-containing protein [Saprospiraceae bacterium]|nr:DUF1599 domain-containing protein [Saprospiraceae bacterium]